VRTCLAGRQAARYRRYAHLIILGRDDPEDPQSFVVDQFVENAVMSSGRPVLLIPYAGEFPLIGTRVMIARDGSREATRAMHDALPFLTRTDEVTVVTVSEQSGHSLPSPRCCRIDGRGRDRDEFVGRALMLLTPCK
jgi:hypothetical protein